MRNYLAIFVAACVGVRVASWLVEPFVVPLVAALVVATVADLVVSRRLS
jgi:predicted PurR-regulated permease PerM